MFDDAMCCVYFRKRLFSRMSLHSSVRFDIISWNNNLCLLIIRIVYISWILYVFDTRSSRLSCDDSAV